ncbi:MAG: Card1-like endonuclease domain-containing protein [Desulfomonilaceae bacterium]
MTNYHAQCTHVCLISAQPIPNLLPLLLERPQKAIFLVSTEMTAQAERLKRVVQPRGIAVACQEIPAYDFDEVSNICEEILKRHEDPNDGPLVLNVTGGTKIAALAAFQVFYFADRRIIYLDTSHNRLMDLAPANRSMPVEDNLVKVRDYLTAYGMNPVENKNNTQSRRREGLDDLVNLLVKNDGLLSRLNSAIDRCESQDKSYANISLNELGAGAEELAGLLERCGAAKRTTSTNLHVSSPEKIFFCQGGWLEEYAYWTVKALGMKGLDLVMNMTIEWDEKGRRPTENEFDVLFTHLNRLHLISCKTANPARKTDSGVKATEALNELDALAERAGGLFGKAMLVSARRLRDADRERAKKMKIKLVDGNEVLKLKEHLREWLK